MNEIKFDLYIEMLRTMYIQLHLHNCLSMLYRYKEEYRELRANMNYLLFKTNKFIDEHTKDMDKDAVWDIKYSLNNNMLGYVQQDALCAHLLYKTFDKALLESNEKFNFDLQNVPQDIFEYMDFMSAPRDTYFDLFRSTNSMFKKLTKPDKKTKKYDFLKNIADLEDELAQGDEILDVSYDRDEQPNMEKDSQQEEQLPDNVDIPDCEKKNVLFIESDMQDICIWTQLLKEQLNVIDEKFNLYGFGNADEILKISDAIIKRFNELMGEDMTSTYIREYGDTSREDVFEVMHDTIIDPAMQQMIEQGYKTVCNPDFNIYAEADKERYKSCMA